MNEITKIALTGIGFEVDLKEEPEKLVVMSYEVKRLVKYFGETPMGINCGRCYEFASQLQEVAGGTLVASPRPYPLHGWLYWNGRHYDSESPNGETDWRDLRIFKRHKITRPLSTEA